ncbi:MAG: peptidoglycan-binding domain-containing protein [Candidatus Omnitrophica bacterium]|nr:peptidoglycan-binding domain-containing protein [Candidatus Omnitrophota bacterium]MDD5310792.1 peptidoglycan-binding domain-containing protein [Candidatus Omnitrophota bacterium]MDD5546823.1 peptidoglycan-binding domain-containing protein [Candidatus Omnitrophota bacterium]
MSRRTVVALVAVISIFLLSSVVLAMGRKVKPAEQQPASLGTSQPEIELVKPEQLEPNPPITEEMKEIRPQEAGIKLAPDEATKNRQIQAALKNAGYDPGAIDGKLGAKSKKAIKEFQSANGLKADGKVGAKTWAKLSTYILQAGSADNISAPDTNFEKGTPKKGGR